MTPIPIFTELRSPAKPNAPVIHPRLVAAIRWDYEFGLLSHAQLVHKYRLVLTPAGVRGIIYGNTQPQVKAARHALAWAKRSWRKIQ